MQTLKWDRLSFTKPKLSLLRLLRVEWRSTRWVKGLAEGSSIRRPRLVVTPVQNLEVSSKGATLPQLPQMEERPNQLHHLSIIQWPLPYAYTKAKEDGKEACCAHTTFEVLLDFRLGHACGTSCWEALHWLWTVLAYNSDRSYVTLNHEQIVNWRTFFPAKNNQL